MRSPLPPHPTVDSPMPFSQGHAYRAAAGWDEMVTPNGHVKSGWEVLAPALAPTQMSNLVERQEAARRMLADQGATFNVYSDVGAASRPWQLDVVPVVVKHDEWLSVAAGIEQRARVLEAFLADMYGPQNLLRDGVIPPALVQSNPAFLQVARGIQPVGGRFLIGYACDLLRGPDGLWRVLRDQTQSTAGLGQVLENRVVSAGLWPSEFSASRIERLGVFYELERHALRGLVPARGDGPNVVVLSPGFRDPAYFEHAYKARTLGFPLVEGADLTVRERRVYLKTLDGLRQVDVIVRRIPDYCADPLETWTKSLVGVPGLAEAWRSGNVALANGLGSGLAESPALLPFMPGLCRAILGEPLKLPFVETWWLGQSAVMREVLANVSRYLIYRTGDHSRREAIHVAKLDQSERQILVEAIRAHPHAYVAQRGLPASTTPAMDGQRLVPRPFVWRTFALVGAEQSIVLRGGLARMGDPDQAPGLWNPQGGLTKDVWVVASGEVTGPTISAQSAIHAAPVTGVDRPAAEVPSRIAEQLFWLGRYAERLEQSTRMLRSAIRRLTGEGLEGGDAELGACLALMRHPNLLPLTPKPKAKDFRQKLAAMVTNPKVEDGLPWLFQRLRYNAAGARDRLSDDTWRLFARFDEGHPAEGTISVGSLLQGLDTLILRLAAFSGMQAENMTRGHGWRFLEVGRRVERCRVLVALLSSAEDNNPDDRALLDPLLEIGDSTMTYRRRHFSSPRWLPVIELLTNDPNNPRSLASQVAIIAAQVPNLPGKPDSGLLPQLRATVHSMTALIPHRTGKIQPMADEMTKHIESFSDLLTQHYFSHAVRRVF